MDKCSWFLNLESELGYFLIYLDQIQMSHNFEIPSILNKYPSILIKIPNISRISIKILDVLNLKFWNTRFFTPWTSITRCFEQNTKYFRNLKFWLNSRNREEDNHILCLSWFASNVSTVTKTRNAGLKKQLIQILIMIL